MDGEWQRLLNGSEITVIQARLARDYDSFSRKAAGKVSFIYSPEACG